MGSIHVFPFFQSCTTAQITFAYYYAEYILDGVTMASTL